MKQLLELSQAFLAAWSKGEALPLAPGVQGKINGIVVRDRQEIQRQLAEARKQWPEGDLVVRGSLPRDALLAVTWVHDQDEAIAGAILVGGDVTGVSSIAIRW